MGTIQITEEEKQLAHQAYMVFNTYAAMGKSDSLDALGRFQRLQVTHHRWQASSLPDTADTSLSTMVHGMTEEACWELPDAIEAGDEAEQLDAIGDLLVYTCAVCTNLRLDFGTLACDFDFASVMPPTGEPLVELYKTLGKMNHIIGKTKQKTRGYHEVAQTRLHAAAVISQMCKLVLWMTYAQEWDAAEIFENTLTEVMRRNWRVNALTGVTAPIGAENSILADSQRVLDLDRRDNR